MKKKYYVLLLAFAILLLFINRASAAPIGIQVNQGGTGQTSFGQGWISSLGTNSGWVSLTSSTSPTVNYVVATSTTASSIFPLANITKLSNLITNGFVKTGSANGTLSVDTNTYLTGSGAGVTAVSVSSANGLAGSSSGGATPALTLSTTISGVLKGNGTAISAAANGTDYSLISALTCGAGQHFSSVTAVGGFTCSSDTGGGGTSGGTWSTTTSSVSGRLINYPNNNTDLVAIGNTATTSAKYWFDPNTQISYLSGNVGVGTTSPYTALSVVGQTVASYFTATTTTASTFPYASTTAFTVSGAAYIPQLANLVSNGLIKTSSANGTLSIAANGTDFTLIAGSGTCTNQFLRSLSASGVGVCATVGATDVSLANLTATDASLTFSGTYNGSTARTIGLNLGNANTWTGKQTFNTSSVRLGTITGSTQCLHVDTNGDITGTGSDCGSGGGSQTPWTSSINGAGFSLTNGGAFTFTTFSATSTTATSTITNSLAIATTTSNSMLEVNGSIHSELQTLATSTSMTIDFCSKNTGNNLTMGVGTSNIAVSFINASVCPGKAIMVSNYSPLSGLIGSTTFAGGSGSGTLYWNGNINPGSSIINGSTDQFIFRSLATTSPYISAYLVGTI